MSSLARACSQDTFSPFNGESLRVLFCDFQTAYVKRTGYNEHNLNPTVVLGPAWTLAPTVDLGCQACDP